MRFNQIKKIQAIFKQYSTYNTNSIKLIGLSIFYHKPMKSNQNSKKIVIWIVNSNNIRKYTNQ